MGKSSQYFSLYVKSKIEKSLVFGDNTTDKILADNLKSDFILLLSGVTSMEQLQDSDIKYSLSNLGALSKLMNYKTTLVERNFFSTVVKDEFLKLLKKINGKIPYFASSGTLLGVIRHQGIIPWDTDIDIGIKNHNLEDFIKFIREETYLVPMITLNNKFIEYNFNGTFEEYKKINKLDHQFIYITREKRTICELEIYYPRGDFYAYQEDIFQGVKSSIKSESLINFEFRPFYEELIQVPSNPEEILEYRFGKDYMTTMPSVFTMDRKKSNRKIIDYARL